MLEPN